MKASSLVVHKLRTQLSTFKYLGWSRGVRPGFPERLLGQKAATPTWPSWEASEDSVRPLRLPFPSAPAFRWEGNKEGLGAEVGWGSLSPAPDKHVCWVLALCQCVHC